ncbi:MAG: CpsD/CapB family tyrosine-protein kinase [Candidatus Eiseniibacteriota bacterium]
MRRKPTPRRTLYEDFDPQAPETTEFRRIFTRVTRAGEDRKIRSILFTSAEGGEGKTTSAALFSVVAAMHQGLRTCLVDADLHRPRVHGLFELSKAAGLGEVLARGIPLESCLKKTRYENLKVMTAGDESTFPSEVLVPDRLATLFGRLKLLFDLVVVDAPPLLPVSDPVVLALQVDGVALVLRAGRTQRDVALRARRILDDAGANLLGVIVNNVDDVLPYYYGHTYYHYPESKDNPQPPPEVVARLGETREQAPDRKVEQERSARARAGSSG